jgi:hypothetical protein
MDGRFGMGDYAYSGCCAEGGEGEDEGQDGEGCGCFAEVLRVVDLVGRHCVAG